jgi:predicted metalloprotease with PDZ domain
MTLRLAAEHDCTIRITTLPLGITISDCHHNIDKSSGIGIVFSVQKGSQAEFIGIRPGDRFVDINKDQEGALDELIERHKHDGMMVVKSPKYYCPFSDSELPF